MDVILQTALDLQNESVLLWFSFENIAFSERHLLRLGLNGISKSQGPGRPRGKDNTWHFLS